MKQILEPKKTPKHLTTKKENFSNFTVQLLATGPNKNKQPPAAPPTPPKLKKS